MPRDTAKTATLYRMMMEDHLLPLWPQGQAPAGGRGLRGGRSRPEDAGGDRSLHGEARRFPTTPQIWIGDERIGGYDALREWLGDDVKGEDDTSYQPVIAIFAVAVGLALAIAWGMTGDLVGIRTLELFVALSMAILAIQKLQDVESFSTMFLNYDLLARRWVP